MTEQRQTLLAQLGCRFGLNGVSAVVPDELRMLSAHIPPPFKRADCVAPAVEGNEFAKPTRLLAAQDLKCRLGPLLDGKAPYAIVVRRKPLAERPIGWNPDVNEDVCLNIRSFMAAEVLRQNKMPKCNITWDKDCGKDVGSAPKKFKGDRINNHHLTLAETRAARVSNGKGA